MKVQMIPTDNLIPAPNQPREHFDKEKIKELAGTFKEFGILQPISARETKKNRYEIISGERRWRACKLAKIQEMPVIVKKVNEQQQAAESLIENVHRIGLSPLEAGRKTHEIFKLYGVDMPAKQLAMWIHALRDGEDSRSGKPGDELIERVCKIIGKNKRWLEKSLEGVSISPEIQEKELKLGKSERTSGETLARLSSIPDKDLQEKTYGRIVELDMPEKEASKFVTAIKKLPEKRREQVLRPGIKVDVDDVIDETVFEKKAKEAVIPEETLQDFRKRVKETEERTEEILSRPSVKEKAKLRKNWAAQTSLLNIMTDDLCCPNCGKSHKNLKWICCDLSVEETHALSHEKYQKAVNANKGESK